MRSIVVCALHIIFFWSAVSGIAHSEFDRDGHSLGLAQKHSRMTRAARKVQSETSATTDIMAEDHHAEHHSASGTEDNKNSPSLTEDESHEGSDDFEDEDEERSESAWGSRRRKSIASEKVLLKDVVDSGVNTCNGWILGGAGDLHDYYRQRRRNAIDGWKAKVTLNTEGRRRRDKCVHPSLKSNVRRRNTGRHNVHSGLGWNDFINNVFGSKACDCLTKWLQSCNRNEKCFIEKMAVCHGTCRAFQKVLIRDALPNAALADVSNGTLDTSAGGLAESIASDGSVEQLDTGADSQEAQFVRAARRSHEAATIELDKSVGGKCG